jgi:hypothetical protein
MDTFTVTSKNGNNYDCHFILENNIVQAIGSLPNAINNYGARGVAFEANAKSLDDAHKIIDDAIKQGNIK